jgi:hypothetical protein
MQFEIGNPVIIKNRSVYERATVLDYFYRQGVTYYTVKTEKGSIIENVPNIEGQPCYVHKSMSLQLNKQFHEQEV